MLIVSKFRDYYDSVTKTTGVDKTIVYERKEKGIHVNSDLHYRSVPHWQYTSVETDYGLIGFCGKLYPLLIERKEIVKKSTTEIRFTFIYSEKEIEKRHLGKSKKDTWELRKWNDYKHLFSGTSPLLKIFQEFKVPIFCSINLIMNDDKYKELLGEETRKRGNNIVLNCNLNDLHFVNVIDPFTAFQEISMYISGVLGSNEKPSVSISDKDRLVAKGFDAKTSFRKM